MKILTLPLLAALASAQITPDRIRNAASEPQNWLTYNGGYAGTHHSALAQIQAGNVAGLQLEWVWQARSIEKFETTPLVVDGVMYFTGPPNTIVAIDARTARVYWSYTHPLPEITYPCCGKVNRGLAILDKTLYMGTLDAKLIAIDAVSGRRKWE
ncbi:MAG TPA: PQQ-binding-like beta-propeller repeat protein, partial [Bryobacteraceae bacterium]|nr:PQQ-binding-like beta-propeller repeat protein [Bryobacteraceae bacterium]